MTPAKADDEEFSDEQLASNSLNFTTRSWWLGSSLTTWARLGTSRGRGDPSVRRRERAVDTLHCW
jgi:hypothetical protein